LKLAAGCSAIVGHIWSIFANFRGGKGINTATGMLLAVAPVEVGIAIVIFLLLVFSTGYISLGSILGAISLPIILSVRKFGLHIDIQGYVYVMSFMTALALLVIFTHRSNIKRLMAGEENRFEKLRIFYRGGNS
jgi:glycerol-3-phosphate acyltransferase PlsY